MITNSNPWNHKKNMSAMEKREKNYKKLKRSGVGADGVSKTHLQKRNTPKNKNKPKKALDGFKFPRCKFGQDNKSKVSLKGTLMQN